MSTGFPVEQQSITELSEAYFDKVTLFSAADLCVQAYMYASKVWSPSSEVTIVGVVLHRLYFEIEFTLRISCPPMDMKRNLSKLLPQ
jgi:hypothetical protein